MTRHLFLDLEDTIITPVMEGWFRTEMINIEKTRAIINQFKPDAVHIFSFAIHNSHELDLFNQGTKEMIEKTLGIKLHACPTTDDIIFIASKVMGLSIPVEFIEARDFWGKQETFRLNLRHIFKSQATNDSGVVEVLFLDDDVFNEEFNWPDLKIKGQIANIDNLPAPLAEFNSIKDIPVVKVGW